MTEQTIDNKVLDRIKKMLALSNDSGATEAERETALRMAYNTLIDAFGVERGIEFNRSSAL